MKRAEIIRYWIEGSDSDYGTMMNLYRSGDYTWSLFMGHPVIEKLLKAYLVMVSEENIP